MLFAPAIESKRRRQNSVKLIMIILTKKKKEPDTQIADIFVLLSHVYKTKIPIDFKAEV